MVVVVPIPMVTVSMAPTLMVALLVLVLPFDRFYALKDPIVLLTLGMAPLLPIPHLLPHLPHPIPTLLLVALLVL